MNRKRLFHACAAVVVALAIGMVVGCKGKAPTATLTLVKAEFQPGEPIIVKYTALPTYDSSAWIGIIPSSIAHGSEAENDRHDLTYKYLRKSTAGEQNFTAPSNPGFYDFRMHDTDSNGVEVASVSFKVIGTPQAVATPGQKPEPTVEQKPAPTPEPAAKATKFRKGERCKVEWKGSWWPARVIALRDGDRPYKIHYDGYSSSWDEWIGDNRIRRK